MWYKKVRKVFTAAEVVTLSVVGIGAYCAYKKNKKKKKIVEDLEGTKSSGCSSGGSGKDPKDKYDKEKHPHGIYEDANYHHKNSKGRKGACPTNGQTALDNSVSIESGNSKERVGISNEEIVILKKTSDDLFHGYVMTWEQLEPDGAATQSVRNALIRNRLVASTGKIIKK